MTDFLSNKMVKGGYVAITVKGAELAMAAVVHYDQQEKLQRSTASPQRLSASFPNTDCKFSKETISRPWLRSCIIFWAPSRADLQKRPSRAAWLSTFMASGMFR